MQEPSLFSKQDAELFKIHVDAVEPFDLVVRITCFDDQLLVSGIP